MPRLYVYAMGHAHNRLFPPRSRALPAGRAVAGLRCPLFCRSARGRGSARVQGRSHEVPTRAALHGAAFPGRQGRASGPAGCRQHARGRAAGLEVQSQPGVAGIPEPLFGRGAQVGARGLWSQTRHELHGGQTGKEKFARQLAPAGTGHLFLGRGSFPAGLSGVQAVGHLSESRPPVRQRQGLPAQGRAGHDRTGPDLFSRLSARRGKRAQRAGFPGPAARPVAHYQGFL